MLLWYSFIFISFWRFLCYNSCLFYLTFPLLHFNFVHLSLSGSHTYLIRICSWGRKGVCKVCEWLCFQVNVILAVCEVGAVPERTLVLLKGFVDQHVSLNLVLAVERGFTHRTFIRLLTCSVDEYEHHITNNNNNNNNVCVTFSEAPPTFTQILLKT